MSRFAGRVGLRLLGLSGRFGLLARFALLSVVLIGTIGIVVGHQLARVVERRTLANAEKLAASTTQLLVASQLSADDPRRPVAARRRAACDALLHDRRHEPPTGG